MHSISIIIPIYKVEKYIERCLSSVMAQTYQDGAVECILVNDCTPDNSMRIATQMIEMYEGPIRFRILDNPVNQGLSCSRNNGLNVANGEYVLFIDSDDHISANCLECLTRELDRYDCLIDMVVGNIYDGHTKSNWMNKIHSPYIIKNHLDIVKMHLNLLAPVMAWNKLIRRQFLIDNHLFFIPRLVQEDELWSLELYNCISTVVFIPNVTYIYEDNTGSIMNSTKDMSPIAKGYVKLVEQTLMNINNELYVEKCFFAIHNALLLSHLVDSYDVDILIVEKYRQLSRQLFGRTLSDGRLSISLYTVFSLFPPFRYLFRFGWFRRTHYKIELIAKRIALFFNFLHKNAL